MKVDLKLLATLLSQAEEGLSIPRGGINDYLFDKILLPSLNGVKICLNDIDYDAFDLEDIDALANFNDKIEELNLALRTFAQNVKGRHPVAVNFRTYC